MKSSRKKIALLLLLAWLAFQGYAWAEDARLTNIIVTNTRDDLLLYMQVKGAFRESMITAVQSGVPTTFSFYIELYRVRGFWFDEEIASLKYTHTIKYNSLKKEYLVYRSWEGKKPHVVKSFDEARKLMTDLDSLKIVSLSKLEKGLQYQIRAKAELSRLTLPFYLHYVLFFVSLWDFETDWYTIDFIY